MIVRELIAELQTRDQDAPVYVGYDGQLSAPEITTGDAYYEGQPYAADYANAVVIE